MRLAGFHDGESGYEFAYHEGERTPYAMRRDDGAEAYLHYDQVDSLRVVADSSGNVIKEVLYDPWGNIIEDTNPALRIPIGFAGGLHDRDLGFVRCGWRDYDVNTGRWSAPDPIGDRGGDPDWYGYCLDDPVNAVDPLGLNPLVGLSQYIPAFNSAVKWAAEDLMDGKPGYLSLVDVYGGYVKGNVKRMRKENRAYFDELYGSSSQGEDKGSEGKSNQRKDEAPQKTKSKTKMGAWGR